MRLTITTPCTSSILLPTTCASKHLKLNHNFDVAKKNTKKSLLIVECSSGDTTMLSLLSKHRSRSEKLGRNWMDYQGMNNWEGLLDPLDDNMRSEILRYGKFVEEAYHLFDFDRSSATFGMCKYPVGNSVLTCSGVGDTTDSGYTITRHLHATCGVQLPKYCIERMPSWMSNQSSWIGYVAVCQDKEEISRLGRRDVVIAFRGTATCMEWLENLRATLSRLPAAAGHCSDDNYNTCESGGPMVQSGFLSLYTSRTTTCLSLQTSVREEIGRVLEMYGDEQLSITFAGHSLGAALATLAAHDINSTFSNAPIVTVMSFGGPRVGNRSFRRKLEKSSTRILRIVNPDDVITKVPGFVVDDKVAEKDVDLAQKSPAWLHKWVEDTQLMYAEVGRELRLSNKQSPNYLNKRDVLTCHDLNTYLQLVNG